MKNYFLSFASILFLAPQLALAVEQCNVWFDTNPIAQGQGTYVRWSVWSSPDYVLSESVYLSWYGWAGGRSGAQWVAPGGSTGYSVTYYYTYPGCGDACLNVDRQVSCSATLYVYANCYWAGGAVGHGGYAYAYAYSTLPYGYSCDSYAQWRYCNNGSLSGSYAYPSCSVTPAANCTFNGQPVTHGSAVTAWQASSVPFGNSCVSESRTCTNGTFSGSFAHSSCSVGSPANCTFNGSPVAHGVSVTAHESDVVPFDTTCVSQPRSCWNGTLSGTYTHASCEVGPPSDCTLESDTIPHDSSVTAYQSSWVVNGSSCSSIAQTRDCWNGALSGTYAYSSCAAGPPATCALSGFAWSDIAGWLSLSCEDLGTCGSSNYKLSAADDGLIFGNAWSDNLGWVSANPSDLTGCPEAPCEARFDREKVTGWLRALWGGTSQSGGWDGFIRLNGSSPDYGVTMQDGGALTGYGWGDTAVGWMDFSNGMSSCTPCQSSYVCDGQTIMHNSAQCAVTEVTTCSSPAFCAPGSPVCLVPGAKFNEGASGSGLTGHLQIRPLIVATGAKAKVYWNVSNVQSCTVSGSNGDHWSGVTSHSTSSGQAGTSTAPIMGKTTFTLHCLALEGASPAVINETASVSVAPTWQEK